MKIMISPAKKMRFQTDLIEAVGPPVFQDEADRIRRQLKTFSLNELKALYRANDSITMQNYERLHNPDLTAAVATPAVLSYVGLQYQSMAPSVFTGRQWDYVKERLFILSGLYGICRACDGVIPYRLEMQAKLSIDGNADLYEFWSDRLYRELISDGDHVIVNLASKEYAKAIKPYVTEKDTFLTCVFGEKQESLRVTVKATAAKIARGEMVRWMAERNVTRVEELLLFDRLGYRFREEYSTETEFVFTSN